MQYGVYVDFLDSVGIDTEILLGDVDGFKSYAGLVNEKITEGFNTRHEARDKAIEKANEIRNKQFE